jgi:hypothetical protein
MFKIRQSLKIIPVPCMNDENFNEMQDVFIKILAVE